MRYRMFTTGLAAAALACSLTSPASAASLKQVSNWGGAGLPADVSMYIYVPDNVVAHPPVLTLVHYCGGTASAVFGQAQGGGIVKAADQYGFIMVVPSSGRCWDIVSNKTRTRDGGGDSHAIKQMVEYALTTYSGNADRVYSTGDSSGGMMTELLLALYPDIFKAGSAFAGMPAGCRGANENGNGGGYSGACAGGSVTHTAQEWGDLVRTMDPGYVGHRPRVQLFHGDADGTINFKNFTEAIKEWSNVLSLPANPTSTDTGVTLGTHQATRQRWKNQCGYVTLDTFQSIGGDHGPSDALFKSEYVIPFLGLDKTGPVDPEVAQCSAGAGGASAGGASGSGGGASGGAGGGPAAGGMAGVDVGAGGAVGVAGGGTTGGSDGSSSAGQAGGNASGQSNATGGAAGSATAGSTSNAGALSPSPNSDDSANGCSCAAAGSTSEHSGNAALALGLAASVLVRRRRRAAGAQGI
jgi:acetylxylan esterase